MLAVETVLTDNLPRRLMFLAWGSPWPAHSGGALRTFGLLREISKSFEVEIVVLTPQRLSNEQTAVLKDYSTTIIQVPQKNVTFQEKFQVCGRMIKLRLPYHCAILDRSFQNCPHVLHKILNYPGVVYASYGHWGTLVHNKMSPNWILDQHNADVDFWRVYASQVSNPLVKLAALMNWWLCAKHFRRIYHHVGCIVSVCEEDKQLTLALAPNAKVNVIQNGVDCSYYFPARKTRIDRKPRLLFTGTSAARNVFALNKFVHNILPLIQRKIPDVELLVAGNFHGKVQSQFRKVQNIRFTGRVDDIRPFFNQSDVYVAPFNKTHGSKLKIAEAMAMGMAIVSTPEGIRGFPLVDGESVLVAYSDEQFASYVVYLLNDPVMRKKVGEEARKVVETFIDWQVLGKRLVQIINSVYEGISK